MKVVHVSPTAFGAAGLFGGGERYPLELARALAGAVDCELVTFGAEGGRWEEPSGLQVRQLRAAGYWRGHVAHPLGPGLLGALAAADVVHAHQFRSLPALVAAVGARARGQRTAVTD